MSYHTNSQQPAEAQQIFGPLPKKMLRSWNLFFIALAAAFLTLAWFTTFPEKLDCAFANQPNTDPENPILTLIALNKNFDFRSLKGSQQLNLQYDNDQEQVSIPVSVDQLRQSIIEQEFQILLSLKTPGLTTNELAQIQQSTQLTLVVEDNRLLEQLIAPIKSIIEQRNKS